MEESKVMDTQTENKNLDESEVSQKLHKKKIKFNNVRNIIFIIIGIIVLAVGFIFLICSLNFHASSNDVDVAYNISDTGNIDFELTLKDGTCLNLENIDVEYEKSGKPEQSPNIGYYKVTKHHPIPFDDEGSRYSLGFSKDNDYIKHHPEETFKFDDRKDKLVLLFKDRRVEYKFSDIAKEYGKTK